VNTRLDRAIGASDAIVNTRAELALAATAWLVSGFSCLQIALYAYGRDQTIYALVADGVLAGKLPYRDVWDFKPPGIFVIFTAAQALLGRAMTSVRVVEAVGVLAMVVAFRSLARSVGLPSAAGLVGGALAALTYAELGFWHTAQPESFGGMLTAYALAIGAHAWHRLDPPASISPRLIAAWLVMGALFGAAFLLKPHLGGGAVVCALAFSWLIWQRGRRVGAAISPWLAIAIGAAVPILGMAAWLIARGAWPALSWTLFEFTPGYTKLGWTSNPLVLFAFASLEVAFYISLLLPAGVLALFVLPKLTAAERGLTAVVFAIVFVHVLGIAAQAKFFPYHTGATVPLVAFLAGIGLYKAWRECLRIGAPGVLLFIALVAGLDVARTPLYQRLGWEQQDAEWFWPRSFDRVVSPVTGNPAREVLDAKLYHVLDYSLDDNRAVGRELARRTKPEDRVYVWGFEPGVYWFANREAATRYVYNVPQRALWQQARARVELLDELRANPPRIILVQRGDKMSDVTGDDFDSRDALAGFPELEALLTQYQFAGARHDFEFYEKH
jgi:hypothetical protein